MKMMEVMGRLAAHLNGPDIIEVYTREPDVVFDGVVNGFVIESVTVDYDVDDEGNGYAMHSLYGNDVVDVVEEMSIDDARGVVDQFIRLHEWASKLWPPRWMTQDEIDNLPF